MQTTELLGRVRRLEIRSRHLVQDLFAGQSESVFKGRGIEFEEVRPYVPGDEVRDIDWNVTARLGTPYVKRFVEERELTVMLEVDVSRSMRFGTAGAEKRELAAELTAVLGFAAMRNNDRVGLVLAGERVEHFVPPARGRSHLLRMLRDVLGVVPRDWNVLARRHDLTALMLRDPRDEALPAVGWVELEDLESGRRSLVNTGSRRVREAYLDDSRERRRAAERTLSRARCPVIEILTDRSYLPVLMRYFSARRSRRVRA